MRKVPVWATIKEAYTYVICNLKDIILLIWPLLLLQCILLGLMMWTAMQMQMAALTDGVAATRTYLPYFILLMIPVAIVSANCTAILCRRFLQDKFEPQQTSAVGFTLSRYYDPALWRLLGGYFGCGLMIVIASIVALLLLIIIGTAVGFSKDGVAIAAILMVSIAAIFFGLRLYWAIAPAAVTETDFEFIRSWKLTAWQFWRILFFSIAMTLPIAVLMELAQGLLFGSFEDNAALKSISAAATAGGLTASMSAIITLWFFLLMGQQLLVLSLLGKCQAIFYLHMTSDETPPIEASRSLVAQ